MPLTADLLTRKNSYFVLWRPNESLTPPQLIIGTFQAGNPPVLAGERQLLMTAVPGVDGLWQIAASDCGLGDGDIVHYWFEIEDTHPHRHESRTLRCTDPAAQTVDWRLTAASGSQPAGVLQFSSGQLMTLRNLAGTPWCRVRAAPVLGYSSRTAALVRSQKRAGSTMRGQPSSTFLSAANSRERRR